MSTTTTRRERDFDPATVQELKAAATSGLTIGGANLAARAMAAGLVDECQLFVWPMIVGGGNRPCQRASAPPRTPRRVPIRQRRRTPPLTHPHKTAPRPCPSDLSAGAETCDVGRLIRVLVTRHGGGSGELRCSTEAQTFWNCVMSLQRYDGYRAASMQLLIQLRRQPFRNPALQTHDVGVGRRVQAFSSACRRSPQ